MSEEKSSSQLILSPFFQAPDHPATLSAIEQIFSLEYAYLRPFFLPAWNVFDRLKQSHLIERNRLRGEIDTFLQESDRGIFMIEGKGGVGKTTLLAQWTMHSAAVHHFFEYCSGFQGLLTAKSSLGAQLIRVCGLADWMPLNRLQKAIHTPNFLDELLVEGAQRIRQSNPDHKICIVLDGLDEIGVSLDQNPLGLPETLPENVYLIISQTPNRGTCKFLGNVKTVRLDQESPLHRSDLRIYCLSVLQDTRFENVRKQVGLNQLGEILLDKSSDNWLYLDQLLRLLEDPKVTNFSPDELFSYLPDNLLKSYLQAFLKIKDIDHADWYRFLLPVLGVLTALQKPIPLAQLAIHAGFPSDPRLLKNHIDQSLFPYLTLDFQERYQFNHSLLKEFFSGHMSDGNLTLQEEAFLLELVENARLFHHSFAQEILSTWGGLEDGLPSLEASRELTPQEEYGLDYLVTHLEGAGSTDELKKLLNLQWRYEQNKRPKSVRLRTSSKKINTTKDSNEKSLLANRWYAAKRSHNRLPSYLEDIRKAWKINSGVGDQVRYALILSSVRTIASKPDDFEIGDLDEQDQLIVKLAACLAEAGEPSEALAAVEMIQHDRWKSQALAGIANYLPSNSITTILRLSQDLDDYWGKNQIISNCALHLTDLSKPIQALEIAQHIPDVSQRIKILSQLASKLIETNQAELSLEAIHHIKDESLQVELLNRFAKDLDREALQIALTMIRAFHNDERKAQALAGLAPYLPQPLQRECFQWLPQISEEMSSRALAGLIPYIHETELKDGLAIAREIKDENLRAPVLVELIIRTAATGDPEKAFKLVPAIMGENYKALAICGIAPYLSEERRQEAFEMGSKFKDETHQARIQEGLISYLSEPVLEEILDRATRIKNRVSQGTILSAIVKRYHALDEPEKALEVIRQCASQELRSKLLVDMAPLWPESMKNEVLTLTLDIEIKEARALALIRLLPYLSTAALFIARSAAIELPIQGWPGINRRSEILSDIALLLAARAEIEESLSILDELQDEDSLSQTIRQLIPILSGESQAKAFLAIKRIQNSNIRISTLVELAPLLPPVLIEETLSDLVHWDDKDRLEAIAGLGPNIPPECIQHYLPFVLEIHDQRLRAQTLTEVVRKWLLLPIPQSLSLWKDTILNLSNQPRPDFLIDLSTLSPVINDLGSVSAIKEVLQSIKDVVTWWN